MTTQKKNIQTLATFSIDMTSQFYVKGGGLPIGFSSGVHNDPNIQGGGGNDTFDKTENGLFISDQNLKKDIQKLGAFQLNNKETGFVKGGGLPINFALHNDPNIQGGGGNDTFDKTENGLFISDQNLKKDIQKLAAFGLNDKETGFVKGGGLPIAFKSANGLVASDQNLKKDIQKLAAFGLDSKEAGFVKGGGLSMIPVGSKDGNKIVMSDQNLKKDIQKLAALGLSNKELGFVKGGGVRGDPIFGTNNDPNIQGGGGNDTFDNSSSLVASDQTLKKDIQKLTAFELNDKEAGFVKGGGLSMMPVGTKNGIFMSDQTLKKDIQKLAA